MTRSTYLRYEVVRNFRNWRFLFLSLAFPLVLYLAVTSSNRHASFNGIAFTVYFMAAMITLGMAALVSSAAVIAADRTTGWTRQMRITPLTFGTYFGARVLNGYLRALLTIVALCLAGTALGVRLSATQWLTMVGLLLAGLIPFAALGHPARLPVLRGPGRGAQRAWGPGGRRVRDPHRLRRLLARHPDARLDEQPAPVLAHLRLAGRADGRRAAVRARPGLCHGRVHHGPPPRSRLSRSSRSPSSGRCRIARLSPRPAGGRHHGRPAQCRRQRGSRSSGAFRLGGARGDHQRRPALPRRLLRGPAVRLVDRDRGRRGGRPGIGRERSDRPA